MRFLTFAYFLFYISLSSCNNDTEESSLEAETVKLPAIKEIARRVNTIKDHRFTDTASINTYLTSAESLLKGYPDSARSAFMLTLYLSYRVGYEAGITKSYANLGKLYSFTDKYDTALAYFQNALKHACKIPEDLRLNVAANNAVGATYHRLGREDSAAYYFYRAASLLEQKDISAQIRDRDDYIYINMSLFWLNEVQIEKGKTFLQKAEKIATLRKDSLQLLKIRNHKGDIFFMNKEYAIALNIYKSILESTVRDTPTLISAHINTGNIYLWTERPENAIPFYTKGYQLSQASNNEQKKIEVAHKLAQAHFLLKDYKAATPIFLETVSSAKKMRLSDELEVAYQYLAAIHEEGGRYDKANEYRKALIVLWKERYPKEKTEIINRLDVQYKVAEKEKELLQKQLLLNQQQTQLTRKNYLIGSAVAGSVFLLAFAGNLYRGSRRRKRLHQKQLQLLEQQQQLEKLQAVISGEEHERTRLARELHDGVGGMLAAIKMNISSLDRKETDNDLQTVVQMIEATAEEVRKTAHNLMPEALQRHNLLEALRLYCDGINNSQNLQIDIQSHTDWVRQSPSYELSVYRILQELIQNIIKHAEANHVILQFRNDDTLHITVEDDGKGFEMTGIKEGLGLNNIRSRVAALGGEFSLESSPGRGTICYIELPFEQTKTDDTTDKNQHS